MWCSTRCMYEYSLPYGLEYNMHKASQYIGELYPLAGDEVYNATKKKRTSAKNSEYIRNLIQDSHDAELMGNILAF